MKNTSRSLVCRNLLLVSVLFLGLALAPLGCSGGGPGMSASAPSPAGDKPVDLSFKLNAVDGNPVDLASFDGKIRVVDFWATWCPPCREAIPHLNELQKEYRERGVAVIGISVDENPKLVSTFNRETPMRYSSLLSSEQAEKAFGGIVGLPSTFVLDREGRIYKSYVGSVDPRMLDQDVQTLLAAK